MKLKRFIPLLAFILALSLALSSCFAPDAPVVEIPVSEEAYTDYNGGVPSFELPTNVIAYEKYSELDSLGRCGVAEACLGKELMPTEDRESISHVYPSGWKQAKYAGVVDGSYLYNRCHLIGFQLAGENDNEKNLITGTRFFNIEGMLPFENMVADYINETENHVMYRVTPVYRDTYDLLPYGVIIEALSVEDGGEGISFCIFAYNKQPGVVIDYSDGSSYLSGEAPPKDEPESAPDLTPTYYVINVSTKRFHRPSCSGVSSMKPENREERECHRDELIEEDYVPCGTCKP